MLSGLLFLIPLGMIFFLVLIVVVVFEVLDIVDNSREHTGQQAQEPYDLFDFHVVLSLVNEDKREKASTSLTITSLTPVPGLTPNTASPPYPSPKERGVK
jgi:hypothetical protein